jgi:hypothetical protein
VFNARAWAFFSMVRAMRGTIFPPPNFSCSRPDLAPAILLPEGVFRADDVGAHVAADSRRAVRRARPGRQHCTLDVEALSAAVVLNATPSLLACQRRGASLPAPPSYYSFVSHLNGLMIALPFQSPSLFRATLPEAMVSSTVPRATSSWPLSS